MIFEVFSRHGEIPNENKSNQNGSQKSPPDLNRSGPSIEFLQRLARNTRYTTTPKRLNLNNRKEQHKRARAQSAKI